MLCLINTNNVLFQTAGLFIDGTSHFVSSKISLFILSICWLFVRIKPDLLNQSFVLVISVSICYGHQRKQTNPFEEPGKVIPDPLRMKPNDFGYALTFHYTATRTWFVFANSVAYLNIYWLAWHISASVFPRGFISMSLSIP